ncbi:MAG: lysylphosphatidylglycerol synthase transmembrane domain-containing protein [Actinomycetota bacterium]
MDSPRKGSASRHFKLLLDLLVVALVAFALYTVLSQRSSLARTLRVIRGADLWLIGVAFLLEAASYLGYSYFFYRLCRPGTPRFTFPRALHTQVTAYGIGNVTPGGGAGGLYFYYRGLTNNGCTPERSVAYVVIANLVSGAILAVFFCVGAVMTTVTGLLSSGYAAAALAGAALLSGVFAACFWLLLKTDVLLSGLRWFRPRLLKVSRGRIRLSEKVDETVVESGAQLRSFLGSRGRLAGAMAGSLGYWAFDMLCLAACFLAFSRGVNLWVLLFGYGIGMAMMVVPVTHGGLGLVEGSLVLVYVAMGIRPEVAIAGVLAYRLFSFWLPIAAGLIGLSMFPLRKRAEEPAGELAAEIR